MMEKRKDFTPNTARYDVIWIQWCIGHLTDEDFVSFFKRAKIFRGLAYIHIGTKVCHRDLKPQNILVFLYVNCCCSVRVCVYTGCICRESLFYVGKERNIDH
ncbi:hypothetical protein AAZV13_04G113000 [Glycine max]